MIDHGADNWNEGFIRACSGGHMEIAKMMLEKGGVYS
jgi:hypothetical protein